MRRFDVKPPESENPRERPRGRWALPRSLLRHVARTVLVLLLCAIASFYAAIAIQHANPPVIAVQEGSMGPLLSNGDLALLQGVAPNALRQGNVIAVAVPSNLQTRDHLPPDVERRIVGITRTPYGLRLTTEADATTGRKPLEVLPSQILGEVVGSIPLVGYVFLFFGSLPGDIVLALLAGATATYFLMRRRTGHRPNVGHAPLAAIEAHGHDDVTRAAENGRERWASSLDTASDAGQGADSAESGRFALVLGELLAQVQETSSRSRASAAALQELIGAVSEYGAHLRSHTAVLRHLATTTEQLQAAATGLADAVAAGHTVHLTQPSPERPAQASGTSEKPAQPEAAPLRAEGHGQGTRRLVIDAEAWREPFTASELRHPNLSRTENHYVADTVDRLLDRAAYALDLVERERNSLRDRLSVVEARLAVLAARRERDDVRTRTRQDEETVRFTHAPPFAGPPANPAPGGPLTASTRPRPSNVPPVWEVAPPSDTLSDRHAERPTR